MLFHRQSYYRFPKMVVSLVLISQLFATFTIEAQEVPRGNLALGMPVVVSTEEDAGYLGNYAVDAVGSSRWSSKFTDSQWIYVDLGAIFTINQVVLNWETAYGRGYEIQVSDDAQSWATVYTEGNGNGGIDDLVFGAINARYVRMWGTTRGTPYGYSLYEFEVYGAPDDVTVVSAPTGNLAQVAWASSVQKTGLTAAAAVDDNSATRWSSAFSDPQWIAVDLGAVYSINHVVLNWEAAYGKVYKIEVSTNSTTWNQVFSVTNGNGGIDDLVFGATNARYVRMWGTTRGTPYGYSLYEFEVYGAPDDVTVVSAPTGNLAQVAWASSVQKTGLTAAAAVDDNSATRWSSAFSDPQWIAVDLGAVYSINHVVLNWEAAYGKVYKIEVSTNSTTWNQVFSVTNGNGGIDDLVFGATNARYVRMWGTTRGTPYGYSLWEIEIYGSTTGSGTTDPLINTAPLISGTSASSVDVTVVSTPTGNLAQVAGASSVQKAGLTAAAAVDGNSATRWSSAFSDPQWIAVDLGAVYSINHVVLNWEAAYGKVYKIEVSTNGTTWNQVFSVTNGNGGIDDHVFGANNARYVRMLGTARGTSYGYSLYEFEVYGETTVENSNYSFQPTATDADGDTLSFSISGKPDWASFNNKTGQLSGTPGTGSVGAYGNIVISVSDGTTSASLPAFSIQVQAAPVQTGSLTLQWTAPVTRTDGTPLSLANIDGYRIFYGDSAGNYPNRLEVQDGTATSATITDLLVGSYYIVMTTYDVSGRESAYSLMVAKTSL